MTTERKNGFCVAYDVKETVDKGLGVFASEPIKQGSIVWRHVPGQCTVYDEKSFNAMIDKMAPDEIVYELAHMLVLRGISECEIRYHDEGALINHASPANLATNNGKPVTNPLDTTSHRYIQDVTTALLADQYALAATRDIDRGEEFSTDYAAECEEPEFFELIYEQSGVEESYVNTW
ncbi:MAG: SET domain-containing protein [Pseudomonadota bacterium]